MEQPRTLEEALKQIHQLERELRVLQAKYSRVLSELALLTVLNKPGVEDGRET